ncbi:hypothetical protein [Naasia sp. SYSU D00057]|uniref:hypothetical protein n=1 Tax=Naasia sp. SYSU D00057 TaxID=2817380 RepID=UPI001B30D217|nr:hypothetical protein [Naasia sp. SYSU D00057]
MPEFLLVYDRNTGAGRVTRFEETRDERSRVSRIALEALAGPNEEVVLLQADSSDSIRVTR